MSDTDSRYRLTLELWASQFVPSGATQLDVDIAWDEGYKHSSYTMENPHVNITIYYNLGEERFSRGIEIENLGQLLTALFAIEETP